MSKVDAIIVEAEFKVQSPYWICLRFVDTFPHFYKLHEMKEVLSKNEDLEVVHFDYSYTGIHEDTDLKYLEITRH
jgi:hypothetical protein